MSLSHGWNYKKYLTLCSLLTSRNPKYNYEEIIDELMPMLKIKAIISIPLDATEEQKKQMKDDIEAIFENKLINKNYIGFINVILLQCTISYTRRYKNVYNDSYDAFFKIKIDGEIDVDAWKNTEILTDLLADNSRFEEVGEIFIRNIQNLENKKEYTLENIQDPTVQIFLIRWIDVFSSDEIIRGYFLNIHYGEVTTTKRWADAEYMVPYDFLEHDVTHSTTDYCINKRHYNASQMNYFFDFYKHCAATLNKEQFRKIRVYFFLQLHEGTCFLDPNEVHKAITIFQHYLNTIHVTEYSDTSGWDADRLSNKFDLLEMIPKSRLEVTKRDLSRLPKEKLEQIFEWIFSYSPDFLNMEPSDFSKLDLDTLWHQIPKSLLDIIIKSIRKDKIKDYLIECIVLYKVEYDSWSKSLRKSVQTKKSVTKKSVSKKTVSKKSFKGMKGSLK